MNDPVAAKGDGVRPLAARDMKAIMRVQEACYHPSLIEPAEALLSKMLLFPLGAWGCFSGEELVAYIVCIPAEGGDFVDMGSPTVSLTRCPDRPSTTWRCSPPIEADTSLPTWYARPMTSHPGSGIGASHWCRSRALSATGPAMGSSPSARWNTLRACRPPTCSRPCVVHNAA